MDKNVASALMRKAAVAPRKGTMMIFEKTISGSLAGQHLFNPLLLTIASEVANQIFGENAEVGVLNGIKCTKIQRQQIVASCMRRGIHKCNGN